MFNLSSLPEGWYALVASVRSEFPKQFLAFGGTETLFQKACLRCKAIANDDKPTWLTNEEHRFLAQEQLKLD